MLCLLERYHDDRLEDYGVLVQLDFEQGLFAEAERTPDLRRQGDSPCSVH